jgi:hypothetical protein
LFEHFAESAINAELGAPAKPGVSAQPKTYTVRRQGKLFHYGERGSWGSSSGSGDWRPHVPAHLHSIIEQELSSGSVNGIDRFYNSETPD